MCQLIIYKNPIVIKSLTKIDYSAGHVSLSMCKTSRNQNCNCRPITTQLKGEKISC